MSVKEQAFRSIRKLAHRSKQTRAWRWLRSSRLWEYLASYPQLRRYYRKLTNTPRLVIPGTMSLEQFITRLNAQGIDYVVLRWFEELPESVGSDLDLLVRDEHLDRVLSLLTTKPGAGDISVDVYTETGVAGTDYAGIAYMPPHISTRILDNFEVHDSGAHVPTTEHYFNSLAYHALYHKGLRSDLPSEQREPGWEAALSKYVQRLTSLATALGCDTEIAMEPLDDYLAEIGWRPTHDALVRYSHSNQWLENRLLGQHVGSPEAIPQGLTVFLVREATSDEAALQSIRTHLREAGYAEVLVHALSDEEAARARGQTRGGNWPDRDGGPPRVLIVALDTHARSSDELLGRTRQVKTDIRQSFDAGTRRASPNVVHSSDDAVHAAHYIKLIVPELYDEICLTAEAVGRS